MTIEQMMDELNESDIASESKDLAGTLLCLDGVETAVDFQLNVNNAIDETEALLKSLRALRDATAQ